MDYKKIVTSSYLMVLVLCALSVLSMSIGSSSVGFTHLLSSFFEKLDPTVSYIIWELRFPRTCAALLIGASLGLSGLLLQTLLQNPLAEPYTLGLSGSASLGAVVMLTLGVQPSWAMLPLGALTAALLATLLILKLARTSFAWDQKRLILTGIMISLFCSSLVTVVIAYLDPFKIQTALYWMIGHIGTERDHWWPALLGLFLMSLLHFLRFAKDLDRLHLGNAVAASLGTPTTRLQRQIVSLTALLVAVSVSIGGLIGFIGLLSPHFATLITQSALHRRNLFVAPLTGASLFLLSDVLARVISPDQELPSGSVSTLIGAPILIYLLIRRRTR